MRFIEGSSVLEAHGRLTAVSVNAFSESFHLPETLGAILKQLCASAWLNASSIMLRRLGLRRTGFRHRPAW